MKTLFIAILTVIGLSSLHAEEKGTKVNDATTSASAASIILEGAVIDKESGEFLVGIEVKVEGTDLKTYTDFDCNFSFDKIKPGEYKIVTNYISYEQVNWEINVERGSNNVNIGMEASK